MLGRNKRGTISLGINYATLKREVSLTGYPLINKSNVKRDNSGDSNIQGDNNILKNHLTVIISK